MQILLFQEMEMAKIQVIDRAENHVNDVIPTQAKREAYVQSRRDAWDEKAKLDYKLANGKTSTPNP